MRTTHVLGVDASLTATGLCLPSSNTFVIKTGGAGRGDFRLTELRRSLSYYLRSATVDLAVVEDLPTHSKGNVAVLGMAHGVVRELLAEYRIPRGLIIPATLKKFATGNGACDKRDMIAAANMIRPDRDPITDDNEADAWWLRQMGRWWLGAKDLDEIGQRDFDGHGTRHRCVFGPWKSIGGAKWPSRQDRTAART